MPQNLLPFLQELKIIISVSFLSGFIVDSNNLLFKLGTQILFGIITGLVWTFLKPYAENFFNNKKASKIKQKIITKLKKTIMIPLDKILHLLAGFVVATITFVILNYSESAASLGVISSLIAGILKEVWDLKIKKSRFDWLDVFATFVGGVGAASVLQFL